jgi:hypothetical protein
MNSATLAKSETTTAKVVAYTAKRAGHFMERIRQHLVSTACNIAMVNRTKITRNGMPFRFKIIIVVVLCSPDDCLLF